MKKFTQNELGYHWLLCLAGVQYLLNGGMIFMKMTPVFTYHFHTFQIVEGEEVAYQVLHANVTHLGGSVGLLSGSCNYR